MSQKQWKRLDAVERLGRGELNGGRGGAGIGSVAAAGTTDSPSSRRVRQKGGDPWQYWASTQTSSS